MNNRFYNLIFSIAALMFVSANLASVATAHDGRRLDIGVDEDGQLFAQGFLSNPTVDSNDGGGLVRPYLNSIHDHFEFTGGVGVATLPGFDIFNPEPLAGGAVELTLLGSSKWQSPPDQDGTGLNQDFGEPVLTELDDSELISINFSGSGQSEINTANGIGESFVLASGIDADTAILDIDLSYIINYQPTDAIYALEWQLSSTVEGITDSESLFTVFAPGGNGPVARLHFQSLALEEFLGTPVNATAVPEPGSFVLLGLIGLPLAMRRKR